MIDSDSELLTRAEIDNIDDAHLINYLIATVFKKVKPVNVEKYDLLEESEMLYEADFNVFKKYIRYEDKSDCIVVQLPVVDEREKKLFKRSLFSKEKNDLLPITDYFIYVHSEIIQQPFGLLEILFKGQHIKRNENDYRHSRYELKFFEREYLYYDFQEKRYVQVNTDSLKKARRMLAKNESIENEHKNVIEYVNREELLKVSQGRLKKTGHKFLKNLLDFKPYWYVTGKSICEIATYLNRYSTFLKELEKGLKIYLLYGFLNVIEFEKLVIEREKMMSVIFETGLILEELLHKMKEVSRYAKQDLTAIDLTYHLPKDSEEEKIYTALVDNQLNKLQAFLKPNMDKLNLDGYIGYDLERGELYPNIVQIEKRRAYADESTNIVKETDHKNNILKWLKDKKKQDE